jgi:SAM-dependent methyltransferase
MLTVDFGRFAVGPETRVLDVGCGGGRHAFEAYRRGAQVVALDRDEDGLTSVSAMFSAMAAAGEALPGATAETVRADALALPFPDASFDRVVAAEVLEHIPDDRRAIAEIVRVLRPGGRVAVSVPRWLPERICWALSDAYHEAPGGHVRIYRGDELAERLVDEGLRPLPSGRHHAHALHAPYWWLKCAVGVDREDHPLALLYHRFLVWDLTRRPSTLRAAERLLDPLLGKSLVLYLEKPARPRTEAVVAAA